MKTSILSRCLARRFIAGAVRSLLDFPHLIQLAIDKAALAVIGARAHRRDNRQSRIAMLRRDLDGALDQPRTESKMLRFARRRFTNGQRLPVNMNLADDSGFGEFIAQWRLRAEQQPQEARDSAFRR